MNLRFSKHPAFLALLLVLSLSASLVATAPVPRKSPELKFRDTEGKEKMLSSLNGKVVVIEFLLVNCPHCVRVARLIDKLHGELGLRGFQPVAVAFDNGINGSAVTSFVQSFKGDFAAGYTSSEEVDRYLGRTGRERLQVPQIVVIDRKGIIRAQSQPAHEMNLENENYLAGLIDRLLKESAPPGRRNK